MLTTQFSCLTLVPRMGIVFIAVTGPGSKGLVDLFNPLPRELEESMSTDLDDLVAAFTDEMQQTIQRYAPYAQRAEEAGFPHVARLFRALVTSETVRTRLVPHGLQEHANDPSDYYVCPHCGLIFIHEAPEKCPADETPGVQFEKIS